jgi:hypothetical protein
MRLRLISTAFAISILPMAANAQLSIDMNSIKCDQYLAMSPSMTSRLLRNPVVRHLSLAARWQNARL